MDIVVEFITAVNRILLVELDDRCIAVSVDGHNRLLEEIIFLPLGDRPIVVDFGGLQ